VEEGSDICLISTGTILPVAMEAAENLRKGGVSCRVVSMHTVKPLDEACLEDAFSRFPLVATIEEHSVLGGLGSAVLEWMNAHERPCSPLLRFGTPDAFFEQSGEQGFAREALGLSAHEIEQRITAKLGFAPH
jgi:transketolase